MVYHTFPTIFHCFFVKLHVQINRFVRSDVKSPKKSVSTDVTFKKKLAVLLFSFLLIVALSLRAFYCMIILENDDTATRFGRNHQNIEQIYSR